MTSPPLQPPGRYERFRAWTRGPVAEYFERFYPSAIAAVAAIAASAVGMKGPAVDRLVKEVLPVAVSAAAVFGGFQAAALSIMFTVKDTPAMKSLRRTGHYERLVDFHWGLFRVFAFVYLAIFFMALNAAGRSIPWHSRSMPAALAFLFAWVGLLCFRVQRLMIKALKVDVSVPGDRRDD